LVAWGSSSSILLLPSPRPSFNPSVSYLFNLSRPICTFISLLISLVFYVVWYMWHVFLVYPSEWKKNILLFLTLLLLSPSRGNFRRVQTDVRFSSISVSILISISIPSLPFDCPLCPCIHTLWSVALTFWVLVFKLLQFLLLTLFFFLCFISLSRLFMSFIQLCQLHFHRTCDSVHVSLILIFLWRTLWLKVLLDLYVIGKINK
jgi:hypothetical protein